MHIQLTTSWNQSSLSNITHDASASWSEQVTVNGFKACVLIAGRHFFYHVDTAPSVHWMAYQNIPMEMGVVNMATWYTGSRCVWISPKV